MRLPFSVEFGYINYVLSSIYRLTKNEAFCRVDMLIDVLEMQVFNGELNVKYHEILDICNHSGFIKLKRGKISLTELGIEFYLLNTGKKFEFTEVQKAFFSKNLLFNGPWKSRVRNIFTTFDVDYSEHTFVLRLSNEVDIKAKLRSDLRSLSYLGIVTHKLDCYILNSNFVKHVVQFRSERAGLSQNELEQRLKRNRDQGAKAEEIILQYEKQRLKSLSRFAEGDRVVRVSQLEVDAGYDIRSFDGDGPAAEYNRFIEVKSSENPNLSFYWSNNEMSVAKKLGDRYWIYFVGGFSQEQDVDGIEPLLIQNPYEKINSIDNIECIPNNFRVFIRNSVDYKELGYIRGRYL